MGSFWISHDVFSVKRAKNRRDEDLGVIAQHSYGETEDSPAVGYECVLPPAVRLKEILIRLMQPSVVSIANFCRLKAMSI